MFLESKSKVFLAFCFSFLGGVGAASLLNFPSGENFYFLISLFLFSCVSIIFWHKKIARFLILCSFFFTLGVWRFTITIPNCNDLKQICSYNNHTVTIIGRISSEPDARIDYTQYKLSVISVGDMDNIQGHFLVKARRYPEFKYNDTVRVICNLQKPASTATSTFRYDKYLVKDDIWSICSFPKISSMSETQTDIAPKLMQGILWFKSKISDRINHLWNEPESSLMAGLLYGSKSGLPPELIEDFSKTGVTHIIAVSGFNVTIIITVLMSVLIAAGFWRRQAYWAILIFLTLFVLFTGATASVARAAFMGALVLTAQYVGRQSSIGNILVAAATIMVILNPYLIVWDVGFQLSFLATIGLVYISPILQGVITSPTPAKGGDGRSNPSVFRTGSENKGIVTLVSLARNDAMMVIRETFIQTLSAVIATLPLILYQFGRLSLVAPLVNVLILWIIPWLMLGGFVAVVTSFIFYPLGQVIAWGFWFGLKYVILVVHFFGVRAWASLPISIPWWLMLGMYISLIFFTVRFYDSKKSKISEFRSRV